MLEKNEAKRHFVIYVQHMFDYDTEYDMLSVEDLSLVPTTKTISFLTCLCYRQEVGWGGGWDLKQQDFVYVLQQTRTMRNN